MSQDRYALFSRANVLLGIYLSRESANTARDSVGDEMAWVLPIEFEVGEQE